MSSVVLPSKSPSLPTVLQLYEAASTYFNSISSSDPSFPSGDQPTTRLFASFIAGFHYGARSSVTAFNPGNADPSFNSGLAFYLFFTSKEEINSVLHELLRDHLTFVYDSSEELAPAILNRISKIHFKASSLPSSANTTLFYGIKTDFESRFPFLRLELFVSFGPSSNSLSYRISLI